MSIRTKLVIKLVALLTAKAIVAAVLPGASPLVVATAVPCIELLLTELARSSQVLRRGE